MRSTGNPKCTGDVALPVINGPANRQGGSVIRASRNWPKRVIVLTIVHVLIIAHIIHWIITGRTTTPIEPSEAMEFTRQGVINMGLIFFAIALLSTLILGRWFCGWGCHVVFLQDGCSWFMRKLGVRPKPFRSRLLVYVPLILALYMFVWPAVERLAVAPLLQTGDQLPQWSMQVHLTTEEFWRTFPGVMIAIPFLAICGFVCVYFLGSKGFCTYGCPYGGLFAPVDELSPGRIRVTDDCEQCGHCTAVCTSNVRVHEEVREYGMVVDPGCMKCLDCVSVCPKQALYFGFGKTALRKGPPKQAAPPKRYDLSWPEEIIMALVFLGSLLAYRGLYAMIPLLMAVGMAGVTTFVVWKFWRIIRDANVTFLKHRLRRHSSVTTAGWTFSAMAIAIIIFTLHSGAVRGAFALANWHDNRVLVTVDDAFFGEDPAARMMYADRASRGMFWYDVAATLSTRHLGWRSVWDKAIDSRRAWLHVVLGDVETAEQLLRFGAEQDGMDENYAEGIFLAHLSLGRGSEAFSFAETVLIEHREVYRLLEHVVRLADQLAITDMAISLCRQRLERFPDDVPTLRWLALLILDLGEVGQGIGLLRQAIDLSPNDESLPATLAQALAGSGEMDEARSVLQQAIDRMPRSRFLHFQMASVLDRIGRPDEAEQYRLRAEKFDQPRDPMQGYQSPIAE